MEEIESIIFDWGGVLIDDPAPGLMQYCAAALAVSNEQYLRAHRTFAEDFQRGFISEDTFWNRVCTMLETPPPRTASLWGDAFRSVYSPREEVFSMAAALRRNGYRTGFLSNTEIPAMKYFLELGYDMFDVAVFSCAEGTSKPEQRIYELTLARLGSKAERAVFIDDKADYVEGAWKAGLNTVLFEDLNQVKNELARLSVL